MHLTFYICHILKIYIHVYISLPYTVIHLSVRNCLVGRYFFYYEKIYNVRCFWSFSIRYNNFINITPWRQQTIYWSIQYHSALTNIIICFVWWVFRRFCNLLEHSLNQRMPKPLLNNLLKFYLITLVHVAAALSTEDWFQ